MIYRERLTVPVAWWLLGGLFALSVAVLLSVGTEGSSGASPSALAAAAIAGGIFAAASVTIMVDAANLPSARRGSACLPQRRDPPGQSRLPAIGPGQAPMRAPFWSSGPTSQVQ